MSASILDYHDNATAHARWSNMERLHLMRKQGLIPDPRIMEPLDCVAFEAARQQAIADRASMFILPVIRIEHHDEDTAPSEYCAPESDSA